MTGESGGEPLKALDAMTAVKPDLARLEQESGADVPDGLGHERDPVGLSLAEAFEPGDRLGLVAADQPFVDPVLEMLDEVVVLVERRGHVGHPLRLDRAVEGVWRAGPNGAREAGPEPYSAHAGGGAVGLRRPPDPGAGARSSAGGRGRPAGGGLGGVAGGAPHRGGGRSPSATRPRPWSRLSARRS